jgi:hypothetical protein
MCLLLFVCLHGCFLSTYVEEEEEEEGMGMRAYIGWNNCIWYVHGSFIF